MRAVRALGVRWLHSTVCCIHTAPCQQNLAILAAWLRALMPEDVQISVQPGTSSPDKHSKYSQRAQISISSTRQTRGHRHTRTCCARALSCASPLAAFFRLSRSSAQKKAPFATQSHQFAAASTHLAAPAPSSACILTRAVRTHRTCTSRALPRAPSAEPGQRPKTPRSVAPPQLLGRRHTPQRVQLLGVYRCRRCARLNAARAHKCVRAFSQSHLDRFCFLKNKNCTNRMNPPSS